VAIWVSTLHRPILEIFNQLASMFVGPITGIFLLGVFTKRGNIYGVVTGAPAGLVVSFLFSYWDFLTERVNWMWISLFSCVATMTVGYLVSLLLPVLRTTPEIALMPEAEPG
jgi:SSS family solute:Na+ symporter